MTDTLARKLARERRFSSEGTDKEVFFVLGLADGTVKTGNPYEAYARDLSGHVVRVINQKCPNIAGTPIYAEFRDGRYWVTRVRQRYPMPMSEMPEHAESHKRFGPDPDFVEGERFEPDLIIPIPGSVSVRYYGGIFDDGTTTAYVPAQDLSLSSHVPATPGYARYVRIEKTGAGTLTVVDGTATLADMLAYSDIPLATSGNHPIFAIKLRNGASEILQSRLVTDEVVDLRFTSPGGGAGLPDAPSDGELYGRKDGTWEVVVGGGGIPDAPSDGELYGRKDGGWEAIPEGLPDAPSDGKQYARQNSAWVEVTGGGSGSSGQSWSPDAPPSSPSSSDDEFKDATFASKWTEFDPGNVQTVTESGTYKALFLDQNSTAGKISGIYQAIPSGDFTIVTKISVMALWAGYSISGLCLWEDAGDSTKRLHSLNFTFKEDGIWWEWIAWNHYQSWNATPWNLRINLTPSGYFRLRRSGSTYYAAFSLDGLSWFERSENLTLPYAPLHFGIMHETSTGVARAVVHFFRYVNSDIGRDGIMNGGVG